MKFKVGDIVRGKEKSSSRYGITNENMYRGKIVKVADDDYIDIEILEHKDKEFIGKKYIYLNPKYFKLLREYTYEDLRKSPVGTKITFENGRTFVRASKDNRNDEFTDLDGYRDISDLKNLKDNWAEGTYGKIIKIEEPEYKTVYESKVEILDEVEKRYLRGVIRPFEVKYIEKGTTRYAEFIYIKLKKEHISLPDFEPNTMYKGMEINKKYTLEELGL